MAEDVRLVIWDLDDTFWKGTVTEGGINDYIQEHHDIVIELARRGIVSSVCSKNSEEAILPVLKSKGILDYFVLPDISWDPKGPRLANLIAQFQLRPSTVMFIDDNPSNRAEGLAFNKDLQVESEDFIARILLDHRFIGKDDSAFSRLAQYKLLETRKKDELRNQGSNEDFLRSSGIRVMIDYDVETNIDRAVELINRTNQLNFTKSRLSNDIETARSQLRHSLRHFDSQAGLIRVADNYGDYGYTGFFFTLVHRKAHKEGLANTRLVHFCFSCRTLGMLVEQWVYELLGRPELEVVGEVVTDLSVPREIDWIKLVDSLSERATVTQAVADKIIVYGGCEAHMVGVYLNAYSKRTQVYGNYPAGPLFVRSNRAACILDVCERKAVDFEEECRTLGLPLNYEMNDIFAGPEEDRLYVINLSFDGTSAPLGVHKTSGWSFHLEVIHARKMLLKITSNELDEHLTVDGSAYSEDDREHLRKVWTHVHDNYYLTEPLSEAERVMGARLLIERVPKGSRLIITLNHPAMRDGPDGVVTPHMGLMRYTELLTTIAQDYPYVRVAVVTEVMGSTENMTGADHYKPEVYLRFARRLVELASEMERRSDYPQPTHRVMARLLEKQDIERRETEARSLVKSVYETFLRRSPEAWTENTVRRLVDRSTTPSQFVEGVAKSAEFQQKWRVVTS